MSEPTKTRVLRIHLLVPDPDGPVYSGAGGAPVPIGVKGRYRIACDPGKTLTLSEWDRATGEPWAVACKACKALLAPGGELAHLDAPHPVHGGQAVPDVAEKC